jgi:hypothetical protein
MPASTCHLDRPRHRACGFACYLRRVEIFFDPAETNGFLFLENPVPVPAGFVVERTFLHCLRRGDGRAALHAGTNDHAAMLHPDGAATSWEGETPILALTVSSAPPVRLECAGRGLTVYASGWTGVADRIGALRLGIDRLADTLPCPRATSPSSSAAARPQHRRLLDGRHRLGGGREHPSGCSRTSARAPDRDP